MQLTIITVFIFFFNGLNFLFYKYEDAQIEKIIEKVELTTTRKLTNAGYLWSSLNNKSNNLLDSTETLIGWEGIKLYKYRYYINNDSLDNNLNTEVILHVPSGKKIVSWCKFALERSKVKISENNLNLIIDYIISESGGQFPIRGIVYEDISPINSIYETYIFYNGVTVKHNDIKIRTFQNERATRKQERDIMKMSISNVRCNNKMGLARIISTSRKEYNFLFPNINTNDEFWINIVRKEYKNALSGDSNNLINAKIAYDQSKVFSKRVFKFE